ncbi:MAG: helix-turn-helix transcriptional regulator [Bacteroidales bacterium]|nr:helix-turn-helix transcriptional regulator [Bacteroidales bacterium]
MNNNETKPNEQHWKLLVLILKNIAEKKGISHEMIAEQIGLKRPSISRMLSLKYCPSIANFLAIANAIEVNFFLEDKEGKTDLNQIFEQAMSQLGRRPNSLPKN